MTAVTISSRNGWADPDAVGMSGHGQWRPAVRTDRGLTAMAVWAATLWPLCIYLFVFVATLAAIVDRRRGRPTTYAWTLAGLYSAATVYLLALAAGSAAIVVPLVAISPAGGHWPRHMQPRLRFPRTQQQVGRRQRKGCPMPQCDLRASNWFVGCKLSQQNNQRLEVSGLS